MYITRFITRLVSPSLALDHYSGTWFVSQAVGTACVCSFCHPGGTSKHTARPPPDLAQGVGRGRRGSRRSDYTSEKERTSGAGPPTLRLTEPSPGAQGKNNKSIHATTHLVSTDEISCCRWKPRMSPTPVVAPGADEERKPVKPNQPAVPEARQSYRARSQTTPVGPAD